MKNNEIVKAARATTSKKAKLDALVELKRKRMIEEDEVESKEQERTGKFRNNVGKKLPLSTIEDSDTSVTDSVKGTSAGEDIVDAMRDDIVENDSESQSAIENVSLGVNHKIIFIAPYY